jgi:hypothetical protein
MKQMSPRIFVGVKKKDLKYNLTPDLALAEQLAQCFVYVIYNECGYIYMQVCKYFLEAVEKKQYGWFWVCPNGGKDCHYRHALPPGYVLKSQMKALLDEEAEKISIEEEIENQVMTNLLS